MAANPIYIETDEEILDLVERLRSTPGQEVPLVLPGRSRVGSRFNLQLLRQYALRLNKRVTIISADTGIKNMARENGFATYSRLDEYAPVDPGRVPARAIPAEFAGTEFAPLPVEGERRSPRRAAADRPALGSDRLVSAAAAAPAALPFGVENMSSGRRWLPEGAAGGEWSLPAVGIGALRNRVAQGAAGAILLLGLFLMVLYVPSATVTVVAQARGYSQQTNLVVAPGDPNVHVRAVSLDRNAQQTFHATGVKDTPAQPATGSVTYNNQCPFGLQIHDGQKLDGGGAQFVQQGSVSVDSNATATASVKAAQPGAAGNVGANQVTTIEFQDNTQDLSSCLTVTNPNAMSGGADDKKQNQVTQQDLDAAKSQLQAQLKSQLKDQLSKQAASNETLADQVGYQVSAFTPDHQVNDLVDTFNASETVTAKADYYQPEDVKKALADNLDNHLPAGYALTETGLKADYRVVSVDADGKITFRGGASGYIAPRLDYAAIKSKLAGHSPDAGKRFLATLPVKSGSISEHPFSLPFLPFLGSRIDVHYIVEPVQQR